MELEQLIDRWRGPVAGWLAARGLDPEAADRLAQDVFVAAWLGSERFAGRWDQPAHVGGWLRGIARNKLREQHRAAGAAPFSLNGVRSLDGALACAAAAPQLDAAAAAERDERHAAVRAAVAALPPRWREVVWAFYFGAAETRDVAALLGLSERAVEGRLRRARERLRDLLAAAEATATAAASHSQEVTR